MLTAALALSPIVAHAQTPTFGKITSKVLNGPPAIQGNLKVCFTEYNIQQGHEIQYEVTGASGCGPIDWFFAMDSNNKDIIGQCVNVTGCPEYAGMVLNDDSNHISISFGN